MVTSCGSPHGGTGYGGEVDPRSPGRCGGLEQIDQIADGVREQNLATTRAADHIAAKGDTGVTQSGDLGVEVADDEVDTVAARAGDVRRGGASTRTGRAGQQQSQGVTDHVGERRGEIGMQGEAEVAGIEVVAADTSSTR